MIKKSLLLSVICLCVCLLISFFAYQLLFNQAPINNNPYSDINQGNSSDPTPTITSPSPTITSTKNTATPKPNPTSPASSSSTSQPTPQPTNPPITGTPVPHETDHELPEDYVWDNSQVINITLNGNSITTTSPSTATIENTKITITTAATYRISGTLFDGQIIVNTQDQATLRLILSNIDITCSTTAPIYIMDAKKTIIILDENTLNTVKDTQTGSTTEPNAAIFSNSDLTIYGTGQLNVQGNNNDAIASEDGLVIKSGSITATALDDAIRGKDYLIVKTGTLTLNAGGDGLKSDNSANASRGFIDIESGTLVVTSGADAIEAQTDVTITGGQFTITSGGGSSNTMTSSAKGIKAQVDLKINSGTFLIDSADDNIHSTGTLTINSGTYTLSTGDDAIHADSSLTINDGTFTISKSYEGVESTEVTINGGTLNIISTDDGLNGAGGSDGSGFQPGPGGGGPGQFFVPGNRHIYINGGYIVITAEGDGVDVNGPLSMAAGYVIINGPTSTMNTAIDWEGSFTMTGGFILGVGSAGTYMAPAMTAGPTSTQCAVLINLRASRSAGTLVHLESSTKTEIITFAPSKQYQSIALCSPLLTIGSTYDLYLGGSSTGAIKDGIYQNGVYTPGTLTRTFTITNIVTNA